MAENRLDYEQLIMQFPWIIERGHNCILSPDADGMICGLFMSNYLDWNIVGYYDNGKYLLLKDGLSAANCIFLDTEIYRKKIRSCGHHINLFRNDQLPGNWDNFSNCLNPNHLRERSLKNQFSLKYPMATIHLLLCIIGKIKNIQYGENALFPILQPDGTINRFIDRHTHNLIDWLKYMDAFNKDNILYKLLKKDINLLELSQKYIGYVDNYVKNKKDKIPISDNNGALIRSSFNAGENAFSASCKEQVIDYLTFISNNTSWEYNPKKWVWENFRIYEFTKRVERPGVRSYQQAVNENFLSLAFTKSDRMEFTIESPDRLP